MRNAGSSAGEADVLARKASAQYVNLLDRRPIECADVAEVRDVRMVLPKKLAHVAVVVGHPDEPGAEHFLHGHVQAAVAGAERAEPKAVRLGCPHALVFGCLEAALLFIRVLHKYILVYNFSKRK
jgi:hypothetical protein